MRNALWLTLALATPLRAGAQDAKDTDAPEETDVPEDDLSDLEAELTEDLTPPDDPSGGDLSDLEAELTQDLTPPDDPPDDDLSDLEAELEADGGFEVIDLTEDPEALEALVAEGEVQAEGDGLGTVNGVLTDKNGDAVSLANVTVEGQPYKTTTGVDGTFSLDLPAGTYTIEAYSPLHEAMVLPDLTVDAGASVDASLTLTPIRSDVFVVEEEANLEVAGGELIARAEAAASTDALGRADFEKSTGDTAQLASRVVAATLLDGRFIFVRGLGHRYGNTLLDLATVPSPEPELRTVPLDLFPTAALSAIVVQKTFTPDVPGDFTGGSIQLRTRDLPVETTAGANVWVGANTATSFQDHVTNQGYAADAFGFGNLPRGLTSTIPADRKAGRGITNPDNPLVPLYGPDEIEAQGESLETATEVIERPLAPPNWGLGASWGDAWDVGAEGRLGAMFALDYANTHQTYREQVAVFGASESGEPQVATPQADYDSTRTVQAVRWSALGLIEWRIDSRHRLRLTGLYSRDAEDETRSFLGINQFTDSAGNDVLTTRLRYVGRGLGMTTLSGDHDVGLKGNHDLEIDWFASYANAQRDDPAIRELVFTQTSSGDWIVDPASAAGRWIYLDLNDDVGSAGLDLTVPFDGIRGLRTFVKLGGRADLRFRDYRVRRFGFNRVTGLEEEIPLGTGDLFNDDTIGGGVAPGDGGTAPFVLVEQTQVNDNYAGQSQVFGGYALADVPFARWVTLNAGLRVEAFRMGVRPFDFQLPEGRDDVDCEASPGEVECFEGDLTDVSFLPAASLRFSPDLPENRGALNVRLGVGRTVARPEFRELAPFRFTDFIGGWDKLGYRELTTSHVWNVDARVEWFPTPTEVVAASVFGKVFDRPIEQVAGIGTGGAGILSWQNLDRAYNVGGEIEVRKQLGFLAGSNDGARRTLRDFALGGNVALVWSRVTLPQPCYPPGTLDPPAGAEEREDCRVGFTAYTSTSRPLQGQAPYSVNAFLDYTNGRSGTDARILYNGVGRTIEFVGTNNNADIYREAIHRLDLTLGQRVHQRPGDPDDPLAEPRDQLRLQLSARNLLDWPIRHTQGSIRAETYRVRTGVDVELGLTWSL